MITSMSGGFVTNSSSSALVMYLNNLDAVQQFETIKQTV